MTYPDGGLIPQPYHHMMLANASRMAAFRHGIAAVVRPGDVVVEAGAGTGVLSALAAQAGAKQVYALELSPDLAAVARRTMDLNGLAGAVSVVQGPAQAFVPPEPVDVVICEMLHVGLVNEQQVPVVRALRANLPHSERVRWLPYAAVSAVQAMEIDYRYEGLEIPLIRSSNPHIEDPRLQAAGDPVTYWVCEMHDPEPRVETVVALPITRPARVNAVQIITKAVMTPNFDHPANDWYLFQLQLPMPARDVAAGDTLLLRIAYDAGAALPDVAVAWEAG